jgi:hypothetical protein
MKKYTKPAVAIAIIFALLSLLLLVSSSRKSKDNGSPQDKIEITTKDGSKITINASGNVVYSKDEQTFSDFWSNQKTTALFEYFKNKYPDGFSTQEESTTTITFHSNGESYTVSIPQDEIIPPVEEDIQDPDDQDSDGGDQDDGDDDLSDLFTSPSPTPGYTPPPTPTSTPAPPTGDPECLYWRLSYCVIMPTPTPTSTPAPPEQSTALPPTCQDTGNKQTGRTVITNELCLPEEE